MTPAIPKLVKAGPPEILHVLLDGRVVGAIPTDIVEKAVNHLRKLKLLAASAVCIFSLSIILSFTFFFYQFKKII